MPPVLEFEWDKRKEENNRTKHGVTFSEASTVFADPLELTISDPDHSEGEYRFLSIGRSAVGQLLVVAYTEMPDSHIRIISARKATKTEQRYYEQDS